MGSALKHSLPVQRLACDLGFRLCADPVTAILQHCDSKIEQIMRGLPDCDSLDQMLDWVANKVGTLFEIVRTDSDIQTIKKKYLQKREFAFVGLESLLAGENDLGVTIALSRAEDWEPRFVSVIDYRGNKSCRAYFTKWHEIAHILTNPSGVPISHAAASSSEPVERLMDLIAGRIGFYAVISCRHIAGEISFAAIENLRLKLCPQASHQSALISFTKFWPSPCILVSARLDYKKDEAAKLQQGSLFDDDRPQPKLRAVHVSMNDATRELDGFSLFPNIRVPADSIISRIYSNHECYGEAIEDLSWWEASGERRPSFPVRVEAKRAGEAVDALIVLHK
jgi:hypothetical protein